MLSVGVLFLQKSNIQKQWREHICWRKHIQTDGWMMRKKTCCKLFPHLSVRTCKISVWKKFILKKKEKSKTFFLWHECEGSRDMKNRCQKRTGGMRERERGGKETDLHFGFSSFGSFVKSCWDLSTCVWITSRTLKRVLLVLFQNIQLSPESCATE